MKGIEPGVLRYWLDIALQAKARGWGPDVSEIRLWCPLDWCRWEFTYEDSVTIGEMIERVAAHEHIGSGPEGNH